MSGGNVATIILENITVSFLFLELFGLLAYYGYNIAYLLKI